MEITEVEDRKVDSKEPVELDKDSPVDGLIATIVAPYARNKGPFKVVPNSVKPRPFGKMECGSVRC